MSPDTNFGLSKLSSPTSRKSLNIGNSKKSSFITNLSTEKEVKIQSVNDIKA